MLKYKLLSNDKKQNLNHKMGKNRKNTSFGNSV